MKRPFIKSLTSMPDPSEFGVGLLIVVILCLTGLCPPVRGEFQPWTVTLPEKEKSVVIPLEGSAHRFVRLLINGKDPGPFLVDTGADMSVISGQAAVELELRAAELIDVNSIGDRRKSQARLADRVQIGGVKAAGVKFYAMRLDGPNFPKSLKLGGVLGMDFLRSLPVTLDFAQNTMTVHRREEFEPPRGVEPIRCIVDRIAYVQTTIEGKFEGHFGIDTGSLAGLDVSRQFLERYPDFLKDRHGYGFWSKGPWGSQCVIRTRCESVELLRQKVGGQVVDAPNLDRQWEIISPMLRDGLIGIRVLDTLKLTFDFESSRMWAETNPLPTMSARLKGGLKPNEKDVAGYTPLMYAAEKGNLKDVQALLDAGADPAAVNDQHGPLELAAKEGHAEIVALLLTKKETHARIKRALSYASFGHPQIVKMLLQAGGDLKPLDDDTSRALVRAVHGGNIQIVNLLLDAGLDPNAAAPGEVMAQPLLAAAANGRADVAELLIARGAKLDSASREEDTPLLLASVAGSIDCIELFVKRGAKLNGVSGRGLSALHYAAAFGRVEVIKYLFSKGVKSSQDLSGNSPLHLAVGTNRQEAVISLLEAGEDPLLENGVRQTPLSVAIASKNRAVVQLLLNGPPVGKSLKMKIESPFPDAVAAIEELRLLDVKKLAGTPSLKLEQRYDATQEPMKRAGELGAEKTLAGSSAKTVWQGKTGVKNFIVFGPYATLDTGKYVLLVRLMLIDDADRQIAAFGIASNAVNLAERPIAAGEAPVNQWRVFALPVELKAEATRVEFRVWQNAAVAVDRIYLFKVQ